MGKDGKTALMPKLRFPEFRFRPGWESTQLGDASTQVTERVGERKLTPVSISAGIGFVPQVEKFGRDISGDQYSLYTLVRDGDFVYNKGNSLKFPQGCVYQLRGWGEVAAPNVFISFRLKEGFVAEYFLYCFEKNIHGVQLKRHITSGARSNGLLNVSKDQFYGISIPLPLPDEQQKIADCLTSLDELMTAQGRKVEALKTYKRGLMQQLFPGDGETLPRLRFPEFRDAPDWKSEQLDALAKRGSGHTPNKSFASYYNGGIKWISLADSQRLDKGLISQTATEISQQGLDNSSAVLHPAGSVVLSRDAGVGKSAVMEVPMAVSQHFIVWTCHEKRLSNWFLYYVLQRMKPVFERIATGSTIKTIGVPFFRDMSVMVPSLHEQQRIAETFFSLDTQITVEEDKLAALKTHKKGLMQQLLPSLEDTK